MEKWTCPHCDEVLLGAANRCWKCGQRVRRPLPAPTEVLIAQVADTAPAMLLTVDEVAVAAAKEPPRRGSPFAIEAIPAHTTFYGSGPYNAPAATRHEAAPRMPHYRQNASAIGGVTAALVLGGFSLIVLYFSVFGAVIALMGVMCAIWGLFSDRKGLAMFALILCCLALTLSAWKTGFVIYERFVAPTVAPVAPPGV